jgi:hypothetical protein
MQHIKFCTRPQRSSSKAVLELSGSSCGATNGERGTRFSTTKYSTENEIGQGQKRGVGQLGLYTDDVTLILPNEFDAHDITFSKLS